MKALERINLANTEKVERNQMFLKYNSQSVGISTLELNQPLVYISLKRHVQFT
uniref:Uncharacterized protein n=1 Tax=Heterorhabditis bacteriophora TaxID=37862 RepID=A0A1I7WX06_HETBA